MNKGINTIKEKLFTILFPGKAKLLTNLESEIPVLRKELDLAESSVHELRYQIKSESYQEPTMADLMRDNLGLMRLDYMNVIGDGYPEPYLDCKDKLIRDSRIMQLTAVYSNKCFQELCEYLINCQGNLSIIKSNDFNQDLAGRFSINGISLVLKELQKANMLYEEAAKPPDSFDEHEIISRP